MASQNIDPALSGISKDKSRNSSNKNDGHTVTKRLQRELMNLMMLGPSKGISAFPDFENCFKWTGTLDGPEGSPYESLKFKLSLEFPSNYPFSAPTVKFVTPIFHPNVDQSGNICLDILKEKWSSVYEVSSLLMSLQLLLAEPNNNSPLNAQAADMWDNKALYKKTVQEKHKNATK